MFELNIESAIKEKAARHCVTSDDIDKLLDGLDAQAGKLGIDPTSLYMHVLDEISGSSEVSVDGLMHQIKVMLHNSNITKCIPVV